MHPGVGADAHVIGRCVLCVPAESGPHWKGRCSRKHTRPLVGVGGWGVGGDRTGGKLRNKSTLWETGSCEEVSPLPVACQGKQRVLLCTSFRQVAALL